MRALSAVFQLCLFIASIHSFQIGTSSARLSTSAIALGKRTLPSLAWNSICPRLAASDPILARKISSSNGSTFVDRRDRRSARTVARLPAER